MQTKTKSYEPRIERGVTKLIVPHQNSEVTFAYPSVGPNAYRAVGTEVLKQYKLPTAEQITSLIHVAYCNNAMKDEPEFQHIQEIMKNRWLWVFNRNLWTDKGVYIFGDDKVEGISKEISVNNLETMLKGGKEIKGTNVRMSKDKSIRFVPREAYALGEQTPEQLSQNNFVIASYGKEGAENLAEVASTFRYNPHVWGVDVSEGNTPELRVSALDGNYGGLRVYGGSFGVRGGHAFGVLA